MTLSRHWTLVPGAPPIPARPYAPGSKNRALYLQWACLQVLVEAGRRGAKTGQVAARVVDGWEYGCRCYWCDRAVRLADISLFARQHPVTHDADTDAVRFKLRSLERAGRVDVVRQVSEGGQVRLRWSMPGLVDVVPPACKHLEQAWQHTMRRAVGHRRWQQVRGAISWQATPNVGMRDDMIVTDCDCA